jgi:hypothetical protein
MTESHFGIFEEDCKESLHVDHCWTDPYAKKYMI